MKYYIIHNNKEIYIADNQEALSRYYSEPIQVLPDDYNTDKYHIVNGELILNPDYEQEQAEKRRERINLLSLTKREVFLALYKDKGITPDEIKSQITEPEALIEFEYANEYFRGNPLINLIGQKLGYTSDELDYLFVNKELRNDSVV